MGQKRKIISKDGEYFTVRGVKLEFCSNTMTRAEFFGWIRSALRRLSIKWKPRSDFLKENRRAYTGTNKRIKWEYECKQCGEWKKQALVEVDHIIPCGALTKFEDIGGFCARLFTEKDGYQILCKRCHQRKTHQ